MELLYVATFCVALISSLLSGAAGSGGSFVMAPYWLLAGFTPAQGAATGAFLALGIGAGSLTAFKGSEYLPRSRRFLWGLVAVTVITSMIGPFYLGRVSAEQFAPVLAILTLISTPFLFIPRDRLQFGIHTRRLGWLMITLVMLISSFVTSSVFSILITLLLVQVFKLSVLESTIIRRCIGLFQSFVIFMILMTLGNFLWQHALAGLIGAILGSYLGTSFAIARGERFAKWALALSGAIGSAALLFV